MAGSLALRPKSLPGTAEKCYVACSDGFVKRFTIHIADHQDALRACILNDRRDKAILFIEIQKFSQELSPKNEKPANYGGPVR